jgi:hypothetical protein
LQSGLHAIAIKLQYNVNMPNQSPVAEVKALQQQAEAKRLKVIEGLLKQRDDIDAQLAELNYRDVLAPQAEAKEEVAGKRVRPLEVRLKMSAQHWIRSKDPNTQRKLKDNPALKAMVEKLVAEGSTGYSNRHKKKAGQGS